MATKNFSTRGALVVGVSAYAPPVNALPAVANDVREMAKLLGSKNGAFPQSSVKSLTDRTATRAAILGALENVLLEAQTDETVFIYLAGHGTARDGKYYYLPFDVDRNDIEGSCVQLANVKSLFDQSKSRRVFLWLDFCHAGGILARGSEDSALNSLRRTLEVVSGQGKVIVAACTSNQSAFESSSLGHGLFTHALLQGLKGDAKSAQGEVTASSLYDYIDHQISNTDQQPVFFGEMTGRIVLMHFDSRVATENSTRNKKTKASRPSGSKPRVKGTWIMLGDDFYVAERVQNHSNGTISIELASLSGEEESRISALRPRQFTGTSHQSFAVNNDAYEVKVEDVVSEHAGSRQKWTLTLRSIQSTAVTFTEMTMNNIGPEEIARRRASRLLLGDVPSEVRGDPFIENFILGSSDKYKFSGSVVREVFQSHGNSPDWREMARLKAVFLLKITGIVEHVIELTLGNVRNQHVKVSFKGRRAKRYVNRDAEFVEVAGECHLS